VRGMDKVQTQIRQKEATEAQQKRERVRCNDNQYAALMGVEARATKRSKIQRTKAAPVWNGPKVSQPKAPQGVWGKAAKAVSVVKDMTAAEVSQLKVLLSQMGIFGELPNVSAAQPTSEEQAWLEAQMAKTSQTLEETAEGEAFFDNAADAEDAVEAIAATEQPVLMRQGAFGTPAQQEASLPVAPDIALPDSCNMDLDFGCPSSTDWGDDPDGQNVVCE